MDSYLNANFSLHELLQKQIPKELETLEASSTNLERVAAYCEANYGKASNKKPAFDESKRFTIQSLASVAYQMNQLSSALLRSIELESESISSKFNEVNNNAQELGIQREKSARQEIGKLTMNKAVTRQNKICYPARKMKQKKHQFSEIDFTALDHLGHGLPERTYHPSGVNRTNSILSGSDTVSSGGQAPYDFLLPRGQSTLTRKSIRSDASSVYRTPQVPNVYNQRISSMNTGVYSDNNSLHYGSNSTIRVPQPQLGSISQYRLSLESNEGLPAPPQALGHQEEVLPPPPFADDMYWDQHPDVVTPTPDWVPARYIEKALALYDYEAEKSDELNLRENCIVYVVAKNDDGWYEGVMDGMTGLFPSNYVQTIR
ncbi:hypothetical protein FO519_003400 [Halicephalobus sp. NKZ332]|nr:hypothetical protein FO519_003400 [Halicephalobus sp. NKZ332]